MLPVSRTTHKRRLLQKPFTCRSTYDRQANKNSLFFVSLKNLLYLIYFNILQRANTTPLSKSIVAPPQQILSLIAAYLGEEMGSLPLLS